MIIAPQKKHANRKFCFFLSSFTALAAAILTYYIATPSLLTSRMEVDKLSSELELEKSKNQSLENDNILTRQQFEIIRGANNRLLETETEYQAEIAEIRNQLTFYRRLAGDSGKLEGLTINKLSLQATATARVFHFDLTLTQNLQKARTINGDILVSVRGSLAKQPALLDWQSLHPESEEKKKFSFKYFQQVEAYLTLPEKFIPESVEITLRPAKKTKVQQSFNWQEALDKKD